MPLPHHHEIQHFYGLLTVYPTVSLDVYSPPGGLPMTLTTPPTPRQPTLSAALWLYFCALLLTAAVQIGLQANVEAVFLRLIAALFFAGGLTWLFGRLSGAPLAPTLGHFPALPALLPAMLIGLLVWLPATWLILATNTLLNTLIGLLTPPGLVAEGALPLGVALQLGVVIPICQGFLFWGFLQKGARGLGSNSAAILAGGLYALFGLVSTEFGYAAVPGLLLVGLMAAFTVRYTGSAWAGMAVVGGYSVIRPLIERTALETDLFNFLGTTPEALFGGWWLLLSGLTAFLAFLVLQFIRGGQAAPPTQTPPAPEPIKKSAKRGAVSPTSSPDTGLGRVWFVPLTLSLAFCLLIGYGEWAARNQNPTATPPLAGPGSTIVPIPATATPKIP